MCSVYDEDEKPPLPVPVQASRSGVLDQKTYCEYPAVANGADHDGFAVMVHVKAPALVTAATLDLVAVLDVGESMAAGAKLAQVKRAMAFVVDRLGPRDRLSVVTFSGDAARQVNPLTRMTDDGKAAAKLAVDALEASATTTNVRAGLDEAAKVLRGRRQGWKDVASVILVSDGHSSCVVPEFFRSSAGSGGTPVHTFGLASDKLDAAAMHDISDSRRPPAAPSPSSRTTPSSRTRWRSASADSYLSLPRTRGSRSVSRRSPSPWTTSTSRRSSAAATRQALHGRARMPRSTSATSTPTRSGASCSSWTSRDSTTPTTAAPTFSMLNATIWTWRAGRRWNWRTDSYDELERPVEVAATDAARCVEVERELLRVAAAEDMALAREAAERGAYAEAVRILDARRESLRRSAPALSGDAVCAAVAAELRELRRRVSDEREYRKTGRACILASMTSHGLQRGSSSVPPFGYGVGYSSVFTTPAMRKMEKLSEVLRRRQQQEALPRPPLPENGSKTVGSRRLEARLAAAAPRLSMLSKYRRLLLKR